jgi:hypothetical protein
LLLPGHHLSWKHPYGTGDQELLKAQKEQVLNINWKKVWGMASQHAPDNSDLLKLAGIKTWVHHMSMKKCLVEAYPLHPEHHEKVNHWKT